MAKMSTNEKSYEDKEKRLIAEIEKKHGKSVEQLRQEREKRITDAMELKEPDRVPVTIHSGGFAARYAGIPLSAMYYDPAAYTEACLKVLLDFEPDSGGAAAGTNSGLMLELLDPKHQRWPGGTLPPDVAYQFVEGEYMKADEYDLFLSDPSDFIIRYYLPRLYGTFEPLSDLPPFRDLIGGLGFGSVIALLNKPKFRELARKLSKAAEEQEKWTEASTGFSIRAEHLGFPMQPPRGNTPGGAPFDAISDFLRGMRGAMLDMYRCPGEPPPRPGGGLCKSAVLVGHRKAAELLLERFKDNTLATTGYYWPTCIARHLGGAAALLERYDEAREHYKEAIRVCTEMRFRPELALTSLQLAELLLEHYPDEKKEALEHLDFAIKEFREMKMQPSLERALRHKEILGA